MQLISEKYCSLNTELHKSNDHYGQTGRYFAPNALTLSLKYKTNDILDYGCGKGTLARNLPFIIKQYDPAVKKYQELPKPADIVVCTEVFEHIEPEFIDNVLEHLQSLVKRAGFFTVSLIEAKKTLPDGRNAHILLRPKTWWFQKLSEYFEVIRFEQTDDTYNVNITVEPLKNEFSISRSTN